MSQENKPKKSSSLVRILLSLVVVAIFGIIIYFTVSSFIVNYSSLTYDAAIDLIYNDAANEKIIYRADIEYQGSVRNVKLYVAFKNSEGPNYKNEIYTFDIPSEDLDRVQPRATPSHDGETMFDAISNEVYYAKELVKADPNAIVFSGNAKVKDSDIVLNNTIYRESAFLSWLPTIISVLVSILIFFFLFRMLSSSIGSNNKAMDFNKSRARRTDDSKVRFSDVAGCDEEKNEMVELVDYLKDPKKYTKCGAKLPKGVILVGPPGTGKTLLAKAVAGEANVPFYSISGSDFVEMFVGVGAGRVRDLFKTAKQNAPCIVFIDEIDAVGRQRGAGLGGGNDEREQTLNQLLVELDGFEENSGIIVIAATNRSDVLDPALLRAGRFDRQITVNLPDKKGREAIFKVHARNKKLDPNVDFAQLSTRTVGFSGADIANILNEAAILTVRNNHELITMADIDEAIDRRFEGPAKSNRTIAEKEKRQIAFHEAGHAIIGLSLEAAEKVRKITIIPRGQVGGWVLMTPEQDKFNYTKSELEAKICGLLGGRTSEEIFFGDISTGASNDIERATMIARSMVVEYGMSSLGPIQYEKNSGSVFLGRDYTNAQKNFSVAVADEIDKEIRKIIEEAHREATRIVKERKDDVTLIAETLLEYETINEYEIQYLLEHREMPKDTKVQRDAAKAASTAHLDQISSDDSIINDSKPEIKEEPKVEEESKTEETSENKE